MVALAALDSLGNALARGGAALEATLRIVAVAGDDRERAAAEAQPAEVADRGDGTYEVACSLQRACEFEVGAGLAYRAETASQSR